MFEIAIVNEQLENLLGEARRDVIKITVKVCSLDKTLGRHLLIKTVRLRNLLLLMLVPTYMISKHGEFFIHSGVLIVFVRLNSRHFYFQLDLYDLFE